MEVPQIFYGRYAEDIFCIVHSSLLDNLMDTFNNYHPNLRFTIESKSNHFLNVDVY